MKDLYNKISSMYYDGSSEQQIAQILNTSVDFIRTTIDQIEEEDFCFDESMDGDFDSAMTSAGFGTDEDYGYYGE